MMVMMPFMFISSAFAPLDTMPGWMRAIATLNPVAHAADALRGSVLGTATLGDTIVALAAAAALWLAVSIRPAGVRRRLTSAPLNGSQS
jgi:ABC-2 type transport system permease protein